MIRNLNYFYKTPLTTALAQFFKDIDVPMAETGEAATSISELLTNNYRDEFNNICQDVYWYGFVKDDAFENIRTAQPKLANIRGRAYDALLVFGIDVKRENAQGVVIPPSRTQLFDICRAFNREFPEQPVVLVFRYQEHFVSIGVCERLAYKRTDKVGDKVGKVSLIRDIDVRTGKMHEGHRRILQNLSIPRSGKNAVQTFEQLYNYWIDVLNVSVLNKKFYEELSNWYFWAIQNVQFPNEPTDGDKEKLKTHRANNVIRLITRLIFTWFLKEKKLVNDTLFNLDELAADFINFDTPKPHEDAKSTYYQAVLQNLFFATLNQEMNARQFRTDGNFRGNNEHYNIKNLFRYKKIFKNPEKALELFSNIPFLNGGLFECLDDERHGDKGVIDGFSDKPSRQAHVPNFLFFQNNEIDCDLNDDYGTKGKKHKVRGIIPILNSYKFTIAENTPLEEEVALDPELLGRIFENLLASYNPETKTSARKQTGSFYTPREIVNYMVDESLIAYLKNALETQWKGREEVLEQHLRTLFAATDVQPFNDERDVKKLIEALDNCKILDPACGSGAFPMGILHRMVTLLHKLDPNNALWKQRQLDNAEIIEDTTAREEAIKAIERAFDKNELDYGRKLYLIENCIYGVDIQPIAVQIAKLRFFISLICEQKMDDNEGVENNRGVLALPNLETKFVAANTLIGLDTKNLIKPLTVENLIKERKELHHRIFSTKRYAQKKIYRKREEELRTKIKEELMIFNSGGNIQQLADWNPFDQNASAPFFDAEWMFNIKNGFDVVIGNPPYVEHKKLKEFSSIFKKQFSTYAGTADLYVYFYEHGLKALKEKGNLCFITSNKFIKTEYGRNLRDYFGKHKILQIIDFTDVHVFDALVASCILIVEKGQAKNQKVLFADTTDEISTIGLKNFIKQDGFFIEQIKLKPDLWLLENENKAALKNIIENQGQAIAKTEGIAVYRGVTTGFNPAFIIDERTKNTLIQSDAKNNEIIKPLLQGRNIRKWAYKNSQDFLLQTEFDKNIPMLYPKIYEHLENYIEELITRSDKGKDWWNLRACKYYPEFDKEKIIWGLTADKWAFAYDDKGHYLPSNGYILTSSQIPIKYLLALLNSKVLQYYFSFIGIMTAGGAYTLKHSTIQDMPIKITTQTKVFISLVDYILFQKVTPSVPAYIGQYFEQVIDGMVCELYFEEEMKGKNLDIIGLVSQDLAGLPPFDTLSDADKQAQIQTLYKKWTAPASEINNRLVLMPVRSPDVLGVILEGK